MKHLLTMALILVSSSCSNTPHTNKQERTPSAEKVFTFNIYGVENEHATERPIYEDVELDAVILYTDETIKVESHNVQGGKPFKIGGRMVATAADQDLCKQLGYDFLGPTNRGDYRNLNALDLIANRARGKVSFHEEKLVTDPEITSGYYLVSLVCCKSEQLCQQLIRESW